MTGEPPSDEAWRRFRAALADANASDDAFGVLTAVLALLREVGVPAAEAAVLIRLRHALIDIADGREVPEMLRPAPRRKGGRPPPSMSVELQRAFAIALADVLHRDGRTRREADAMAARRLASLPALRGAKNGAKAIARWREDSAADVGRKGVLRIVLDGLRAELAREGDARVNERDILRAAATYGVFRFGRTKPGKKRDI